MGIGPVFDQTSHLFKFGWIEVEDVAAHTVAIFERAFATARFAFASFGVAHSAPFAHGFFESHFYYHPYLLVRGTSRSCTPAIFLRRQYLLDDSYRFVFDVGRRGLHAIGNVYCRRHFFVGDVIDVRLAAKPNVLAETFFKTVVEVAPP